jgi:hypothetical protein
MIFAIPGPRNIACTPKTQVLHLFTFDECSKTLAKVILGPKQYNGCIWCETIFPTSVPKIVHSCLKQSFFCIFYILKVFETLEKNPNHHFLSNGVECMHFVRNHFCNLGAPKQWIHCRNKSCLSFYITKVFKLLENNPNHHFFCNGVEWMHLVRNHSHNFGTPKYYIKDKTQVLGLFTCGRFTKCSKTAQKIILGLLELNEWICCVIIFNTSVPKNSVFMPET